MSPMIRSIALLFAVLNLFTLSLAAAPTSFCKCTCFSNSTIIPLGPAPPSSPHQTAGAQSANGQLFSRAAWKRAPADEDVDKDGDEKSPDTSSPNRHASCNDCTRLFCLDYNLPICKGATEEDVFTTCFQRDSRKDEAVVFIFIIATVGLLAYAAVRPWVESWIEVDV